MTGESHYTSGSTFCTRTATGCMQMDMDGRRDKIFATSHRNVTGMVEVSKGSHPQRAHLSELVHLSESIRYTDDFLQKKSFCIARFEYWRGSRSAISNLERSAHWNQRTPNFINILYSSIFWAVFYRHQPIFDSVSTDVCPTSGRHSQMGPKEITKNQPDIKPWYAIQWRISSMVCWKIPNWMTFPKKNLTVFSFAEFPWNSLVASHTWTLVFVM